MNYLRTLLFTACMGLGLLLVGCLPGCQTSKAQKQYATPLSQGIITEEIPGLGMIQVSREHYFNPEEIAHYVEVFYRSYDITFGDEDGKVREVLSNIVLVWEPDAWVLKNAIIYDRNGEKIQREEAWVQGLTKSPRLIFVSVQDGLIEHTSLAHELVHAIIWSQLGHGDADHEGHRKDGWTKKHSALIDMVNMTIAIEK